MTVDLELMLALRDQQAANEVAERAKMGWFDVEFTTYGCAYLKGGERCYRLSADPAKIYEFMYAPESLDCEVVGVRSHTERYPVPSGMKDYVMREVKTFLAKELQEEYPLGFFYLLEETAKRAEEDTGSALLRERSEWLTGRFNRQELNDFESMLNFLRRCRKVSAESYREFSEWLAEERRAMEESAVPKKRYEKTFYGIAYVAGDSVSYYANAQKDQVYERLNDRICKGTPVSHVFARTYYYDKSNVLLPQVKKVFMEDIAAGLPLEIVQRVAGVQRVNSALPREDFEHVLERAEREFGESARAALQEHGMLWGVL